MSQLSDAEKRLWARVSERDRASLMQIRLAVERIWAPDAPRLVANFTDHGPEHCQRLVRYVEQLLDASRAQPLGEVETYVLLAAIYLHDIGMQCDVPEVQRQAGVEIRATEASQYSKEDQTAIRGKHHLLTAAWLSHARCTGETILAPAIHMVPAQLIPHLMDVCKYHTELNLQECSDCFHYQGQHRKRLLAALLRFADEMDITHSRVNIETVIDFRLPPENAVYWWLHYFTDLSLERNVLTFNVVLHPEDAEQYGEVVRKQVVERFQCKNKGVLDILDNYGVEVRIKDEVFLEPNPFMKRPPREIRRILTGESVPLMEKLSELGDQRHNAPVVCLGSVYLDLELIPVDIAALSERIEEEWTDVKISLKRGGSSWYVYQYLKKLGCTTHLASKIGDESQEFFAERYIRPLKAALAPLDTQSLQGGDYTPTEGQVRRAKKAENNNRTAMTVHLIQCSDPGGKKPIAKTMLTDTGVLESLRWDDDEIQERIRTLDDGGVLYLSGYFKTALHQDLEERLKDLDRKKDVIICLDHGRFSPWMVGAERIDPLRESLKYINIYFCTTREMRTLFGAELSKKPELEKAPIEKVLEYLDEQLGLELPEVILVRDNKGRENERLIARVKFGHERVPVFIPVHRIQAKPERFVGISNTFHARFIDCMLKDERCENLTPAIIEWALCAQRMVEWVMSGKEPATLAAECDQCKKCAQVAQKWWKNTSKPLPLFDCPTTHGGKYANT